MSEDWKVEDQAEKLSESASAVLAKYLSEHGSISRKNLIELLTEKCDLTKDEAEKFLRTTLRKACLGTTKRREGTSGHFLQSNVRA